MRLVLIIIINSIFTKIWSTAEAKLKYIAYIVLDRTDSPCLLVKRQHSHTIIFDMYAKCKYGL